jgi:hypothetical protein
MKCLKAIKLIDLAVAGALPEESRQSLDDHLLACPQCMAQQASGVRLEALSESLRQVESPNMRTQILEGIATSGSSPRQEKLMKTRTFKLSLGVTTAVCLVALVGALTLTPKSAMALVRRSIVAVKQVTSAKVVMWFREGGQVHERTVWSDHNRTRDEGPSRLSVYKNGQTTDDPDNGLFIAEIDPRSWTVDAVVDLYSGRVTPVDLGVREIHGQTLRLIRLEIDEGKDGSDTRWDYYVDDTTNLPAKLINFQRQGGEWVKTSEIKYQFNIPLEDSLFELPAGKSWHPVPNVPTQGSIVDHSIQEPLDGGNTK